MTTELQQRGRKYKKVKEREVTELNTITELKTILEGFTTEELSTACALDGCAQAAEMRVLRTALNPYPGKQAAQHRGT